MPTVSLGDVILWYPDGDINQEPQPAIVSNIGGDTINVNIISPTSYNFLIRDGVRHVSDPRRRGPEVRDSGAWDYTPMLRHLYRLLTEAPAGKRKE